MAGKSLRSVLWIVFQYIYVQSETFVKLIFKMLQINFIFLLSVLQVHIISWELG